MGLPLGPTAKPPATEKEIEAFFEDLLPKDPGVAPPPPLAGSEDDADLVYRAVYNFLVNHGSPAFVARLVAAPFGGMILAGQLLADVLVRLLSILGAALAQAILKLIDRTRRELDPAAAQLAVDILNELTGSELTAEDLPTGKSLKDHLERARAIGSRFHAFLAEEFAATGVLSPEQGADAAARFTGFVINFAVSTAMLGILGEVETLGAIDQFRELGVEVARNLGLGRLHRLALRPFIQEYITTPLEWQLKSKLLPTLLKADQAVKAHIRGQFTDEQLREELTRQGYSPERIEALVEESRTRLNVAEIELAVRYGVRTREQAIEHLTQKGFTTDDAALALDAEDLKRVDTRVREYVAVLERQFIDGVLDAEQLRDTLEDLPITEREKVTIRRTAAAKLELPRKFLTLGQLEDALREGVIDVDELSSELRREGYSRDDQVVLRTLALLKLAERKKGMEEAQARKTSRAEKAASRGKKPKAPA